MRQEPELWEALAEICQRERQDLNQLVRRVESSGNSGGRTSAVRVFVLRYFREAANEAGHEAANHGALDLSSLSRYTRHPAQSEACSTAGRSDGPV